MWYLALNKNRFDQHPPWLALDNPIMIKHDPVLTVDEEQAAVTLVFRPAPTDSERTLIRLLFSEYTL